MARLTRWCCGWISLWLIVSHAECFAEATPSATLITAEHTVQAARPRTAWFPAPEGYEFFAGDSVRTGLDSRAAVRMRDLSVLRINQLSKVQFPEESSGSRLLHLLKGAIYFLNREKPANLEISTPVATGALEGTEFHLSVGDNDYTVLTMFEGKVRLGNEYGAVEIRSGEQATVRKGQAPKKTAVLEGKNHLVQWYLYYPAVLDPEELGLSPGERHALAASLTAYRSGDLLQALRSYPAGRSPASPAEKIYRAALLLQVGQVDRAGHVLHEMDARNSQARALLELIAAAQNKANHASEGEPRTASEYLARSYAYQSRGELAEALAAAKRATELAPGFGFGWVRAAELEFSFGRAPRALKLLERGLELSPRHAEALALQGFLLASENRMGAAARSFDAAIALDGALGNAWLGRGLVAIRKGRELEGRRDLQTAALLEPTRSIFRSYLGKAFSQTGAASEAALELARAKEIDPGDPTPWLYSAVEKKQENRYNEAIRELERSIELNDNRRIFRSSFLLDQDRAFRGTNLASIYRNNGMIEQSVREAVRAVDADYGSASAHLFLAESYDALRDPARVNLRYETPWQNELLLAHLLAPVGGGSLSQFVSEQEYSKLFQRDRLGISSVTEYYGYGEVRERASQFGTFGNLSYAFDTEYQYNDGLRPNNRLFRLETFATIKLQIAPSDTLFFQWQHEQLETGDVRQVYDPRSIEFLEGRDDNGKRVHNVAALTTQAREIGQPGVLLAGWHHEWSPGVHTLILAGHFASDLSTRLNDYPRELVTRSVTEQLPDSIAAQFARDASDPNSPPPPDEAIARPYLPRLIGAPELSNDELKLFDFKYLTALRVNSVEAQQIFTWDPTQLVLGARLQAGYLHTRLRLDDFGNGLEPGYTPIFHNLPFEQDETVNIGRLSIYAYDTWRVFRWLSLTGGVAYEDSRSPRNFRTPPINDQALTVRRISPKVGGILTPWHGGAIRLAYTEGISGASYEESFRLEPSQVAGFAQIYRSLYPSSITAELDGGIQKIGSLSLEQKLKSGTYLGLQFSRRAQKSERDLGVFDLLSVNAMGEAIYPSSIRVQDRYEESEWLATVNQLLGQSWSIGATYRQTRSHYANIRPEFERALLQPYDVTVAPNLAPLSRVNQESTLQELEAHLIFNHPTGFFARAEAHWYHQHNDDIVGSASTPMSPDVEKRGDFSKSNEGLRGEDAWQFNIYAGYRFYRNQCELSIGVLNLADADYRLYPLTPYADIPRDRTFFLRAKLNF